ncbi:hypothetical protein WHR41_08956 [Cladosporium halotolerans]|uniref:cyclin-dependent kinase n=1 Tax=Cladosporium halotolerans TaxID=1052096 RepID=A0AB34KB57_9PEZI
MAAQDNWQKSLTFSDRLSVTSKITEAYKKAHPDCPPTDATKHAKSEEANARKLAMTLTEYHELCAKSIGTLLAAATPPPATSDHSTPERNTLNLPTDGARIGPYTNATHHQDGLFSSIHRALDPKTNTLVALKITTPSTLPAPHDSHREARLLTALTSSKAPNIIPLLSTFTQQSGPSTNLILALPFLPHPLSTLLATHRLPHASARPVLHALFTALAHLHSQGIIHRDVKPSNILLATPSGPAYLSDFGTAWSASDPGSEPAEAKHLEVGTTSYRPPELLFGRAGYGGEVDLWAAGCVAAEVVGYASGGLKGGGAGGRTLFDSGDLGSELALIKSMFEVLGTPDEGVWPEAPTLPDWGKMRFTRYAGKAWAEILPGATAEARGLVSKLVVFESGRRLRAEEALKHPYFTSEEK